MKTGAPVVVQVVGYKNSGKTTLVCKLVSLLSDRGYEVGTVKHDAHRFEIDHEGKDTWRHREAGARLVAISSEQEGKTCYIEQRYTPLSGMLERMGDMDIVLVEGFKSESYPKIVLARDHQQLELIERVAPIIAVASWMPEADLPEGISSAIPYYRINDVEGLAERVLALS